MVTIWSFLAVLAFMAEIAFLPGIGLLFVGIGCLASAFSLGLGFVPDRNFDIQFLIFLIAASCSALFLWKPLRNYHRGEGKKRYQNIQGQVAVVIDAPIHKGETGNIRWSGTIMKACLEKDIETSVQAGASVYITRVQGNTAYIRP